MPEPVKLGDVVYFGMTVHTPPSGALVNADSTPRWMMFRNGSDAITLQGDFTQRTGHIGRYRSSGIVSTSNGFFTNDYVEIHASGRVGGQYDGCILKTFIIDDTFDADLVKISGVNVGDSPYVPDKVWNATQSSYGTYGTTGRSLQIAGLTFGEFVVQDNNATALSFETDLLSSVDNFYRDDQFLFLTGSLAGQVRPIFSYTGAGRRITLDEGLTAAPASGDRFIINSVHTHSIADIVSGVWGDLMSKYTAGNTFGSGINNINQSVYYSNIKYVRDGLTDRYGISWYKNGQLLGSGNITNPAMSVYNSQNGNALVSNQSLVYTNSSLGLLRHFESTNIQTSGIPYEVITSGTIDGSVRQWKNIVGIDIL